MAKTSKKILKKKRSNKDSNQKSKLSE